ncbi:choice-of-anchor I family protein [Synechococcus sp. CBW1002]|uniref:choice-of-anchor I family protein n=1 Tax=Synechococcus sp. CBW1002 TaxID=1353134 RepID=UPI0018CE399E|nr:choice-of-anchor I family protein [Synechococcus sp. CBW1002]QPN60646.1 choice-of-anchor I family protein [Synechococcus sp. CBW1002]
MRLGKKLFLLSSGGGQTLQITDATNPASPQLVERRSYGGAYNSTSVAAYGNLVAVALTPADYDDIPSKGLVRFFRMGRNGRLTKLRDVEVGYLPDGIAFSKDGRQLVIANEAQPSGDYGIDPAGSIGIIDIKGSRLNPRFNYTDLSFDGLDLPTGLRISGPDGTTASQDIEPEYISILGDKAYVSLQENNGVAVVDLRTRRIVAIHELGSVDYSQLAVDLSDRDGSNGGEDFLPQLGQDFVGLRMPDGISAFQVEGKTYYITANEGDAREYGDYEDIARNPAAANGRLDTILASDGTPTNVSLGSRSVSIFDAQTGELVWDSGNSLQTIAFAAGTYDDGRSDAKGVEPETVTTIQEDGRTYAIVGMERGLKTTLVIFDISEPTNGQYVSHSVIEGSLSPEGLLVIPAKDSPTRRSQLVISNEVSNTLDILDLSALINTPGPGSAGVFEHTMLKDVAGGPELQISSLITNGEFTNGLEPGASVYTPTGIFDGLGAYDNGDGTYTVLANSELNNGTGTPYVVGGVALNGARIHKLIVDKDVDDDASNGYQSAVIDGGIAYTTIVDANGNLVTDAAQLNGGFNRFCSGSFEIADRFGAGHGFVDSIYLTGEETDEGLFYALDTATETLYALPGLGRGGWETAVQVDTGSANTVAVILMDDNTSPLYLWVGSKSVDPAASFLERNGLAASQGNVYTWVPTGGSIGTDAGLVEQDYTDDDVDNPVAVPDSADLTADLNGLALGTAAAGSWELVGDGSTVASWDEATLRANANALGALQLSRLEDASINPTNGQQVVFATTGNSAFAGADTFGNLITLDLSGAFNPDGEIVAGNNSTNLTVIYDGDREISDWETTNGSAIDTPEEQAAFGATIIRSPDNLTWSADGSIYVQEDRSVPAPYFAQEEASIWKVSPTETDSITGQASTERWAQIDRTAVPTDYGQTDPSATDPGNWESSGILDVSTLYNQLPGTSFLADVQAHSLRDGNIGENGNLVQGGQLNLIQDTGVL